MRIGSGPVTEGPLCLLRLRRQFRWAANLESPFIPQDEAIRLLSQSRGEANPLKYSVCCAVLATTTLLRHRQLP